MPDKSKAKITCIDEALGLWCVSDETNGYLIVRNGKSLLIDCPYVRLEDLTTLGLPRPDFIIHTQIQEEHCREWSSMSEVPVWVAEQSYEIATRSESFFRDAKTLWPLDRDWSTLGEDNYGIAGCVTERPPSRALNVQRIFRDGDVIKWQDIELRVVSLPGSGKRSVGFVWDAARIVFTGDLIYAGGRVVNFYDYELSYGGLSLPQIKNSLAKLIDIQAECWCPTTGPVITNISADYNRLLAFLKRPCVVERRRVGMPRKNINFEPLRTFGRYRELVEGLYQSANFGNIVLYVDSEGNGLLVDPCNCVWDFWEPSVASMKADLDLLEHETGLKNIEVVLLTHPHGDHVQYADLLRERYGSTLMATPDVALMLKEPERFPYPCMLDWYNFPFRNLIVDEIIKYDNTIFWHDVPITPVHTPGHCYAHAGFLIEWQGSRTFCAGDVIKYGEGVITAGIPFCHNDNGFPDRSPAVAYERMAALNLDLVVAGHSHAFKDPDGSIMRDFAEVWREQVKALADFVPDNDLLRATTPPGYDQARLQLDVSNTAVSK